jgi:hypothetical protein
MAPPKMGTSGEKITRSIDSMDYPVMSLTPKKDTTGE